LSRRKLPDYQHVERFSLKKIAYRPREAMSALGVKSSTFWKWAKEGRIITKKVGGVTLVPAESLEALINGGETQSANQ
jgi:hypothetical protein